MTFLEPCQTFKDLAKKYPNPKENDCVYLIDEAFDGNLFTAVFVGNEWQLMQMSGDLVEEVTMESINNKLDKILEIIENQRSTNN